MADIIARLLLDDNNYNKKINNAKKDLLKFAAQVGVATSAMALFTNALKANIQTASQFEKSMSSLKALTGLGSEAMGQLKQAAIDLGGSTTQSASQVADAFKLIGSAKPELLNSVSALKNVTAQAITLAEAAGIEVPEAASALTTSLNQMGAGADQAERFVNVLAAGSQKGAGDINWLNEAITQSGTAAKAVGTEYEELVANLEQLAQGGFQAGAAGTALRSIIMSLEKQSNNKLKPSVVGMTQAFANLGEQCKSVTDYQDILGKQFASQGQVLAENAEKAKKLRIEITGTSTAEEQAKINTDNFNGAIKNLESAWEKFNLTLNSSNGLLTEFIKKITSALGYLSDYMGADSLSDAEVGKALATQTAKYRKEIEELNKAYQKGTISQKEFKKRSEEIKEAMYKLEADLKGGSKKLLINGIGVEVFGISEEDQQKVLKTFHDLGKAAMDSYYEGVDAKRKSKSTVTTTTPEPGNTHKDTNPYAAYGMTDKEYLAMLQKFVNEANDATNIFGQMTQSGVQLRDVWADIMTGPTEWLDEVDEGLEEIIKKMIETQKAAKATGDGFRSAMSATSQLGGALASLDNPAAKILGTIGQAIATVAMAYSDALAKDESSKFNIWSFIAASTAATISMVSTIASIKSATAGSYADGGLIGGNNYSTDKNIVAVNSGELILNKAQQNAIASQLQGGSRASAQPYVSGEMIWLGLNNYMKRTGRGEIVTSK